MIQRLKKKKKFCVSSNRCEVYDIARPQYCQCLIMQFFHLYNYPLISPQPHSSYSAFQHQPCNHCLSFHYQQSNNLAEMSLVWQHLNNLTTFEFSNFWWSSDNPATYSPVASRSQRRHFIRAERQPGEQGCCLQFSHPRFHSLFHFLLTYLPLLTLAISHILSLQRESNRKKAAW